jgi:hypothetical protein
MNTPNGRRNRDESERNEILNELNNQETGKLDTRDETEETDTMSKDES